MGRVRLDGVTPSGPLAGQLQCFYIFYIKFILKGWEGMGREWWMGWCHTVGATGGTVAMFLYILYYIYIKGVGRDGEGMVDGMGVTQSRPVETNRWSGGQGPRPCIREGATGFQICGYFWPPPQVTWHGAWAFSPKRLIMGRLISKRPLIITAAPLKVNVNRQFGVRDSKHVVIF